MMDVMQAPPDPVLAVAGGLVGGVVALAVVWRRLWRGLL